MHRRPAWNRPAALLAAVLVLCYANRCPAQVNLRALPPEAIPAPPPAETRLLDTRPTNQSARNGSSRRTAAAKLPQQPLPLVEFRGVPLGDAMQAFAEQTELNIVTSPEAAKAEISVYLRNVKPLEALEAITKANDLYYVLDEQSGIIRISTTKEYERSLSSFREERTEVFTLLYPNPAAVALAIRNVFGDAKRGSATDDASDGSASCELPASSITVNSKAIILVQLFIRLLLRRRTRP